MCLPSHVPIPTLAGVSSKEHSTFCGLVPLSWGSSSFSCLSPQGGGLPPPGLGLLTLPCLHFVFKGLAFSLRDRRKDWAALLH